MNARNHMLPKLKRIMPFLTLFIALFLILQPLYMLFAATTFTVNSSDSTNDGTCNISHCSLVEAITQANNVIGSDIIQFNIPGTGPHIITTNTGFVITESVTLDATTQPGYTNQPIVEIRPVFPTSVPFGIQVGNSGAYNADLTVIIRGFAVNNFTVGSAIVLKNGQGHLLENNNIGTNADRSQMLGNNNGVSILTRNSTVTNNYIVFSGNTGIVLANESEIPAEENILSENFIGGNQRGILIHQGASSNTVQGNTIGGNAAEGVLIQGPITAGNVLQGNRIGMENNGGTPFPNGTGGIVITNSDNNLIGGPALSNGNLISSNNYGVGISATAGFSASGNVVENNFIGTDATGTLDRGNLTVGINLSASNNTVQDNVIAGNNTHGFHINDSSATGNTVQRNYIGTNQSQSSTIGNTVHGIYISAGANNNLIGSNVIARNLSGIYFESNAGTGNHLTGNLISQNTSLGIEINADGVTVNDPGDADTGPNTLQNFPVLTVSSLETTIINGTLNSTPNQAYTIELFQNTTCDASGNGEGEIYLASVTMNTDGTGNGSFSYNVGSSLPDNQPITATATDSSGNTSEFSTCARAFTDVTLTHIDSSDPVLSGTSLTYTINVNNSGANYARGVVVTETLPTSVSFVSANATLGTCNHSSGIVSCNIGTLTNGATTSVTIQVNVNPATTGSFNATANATSTTFDSNTANNNASQTTQST